MDNFKPGETRALCIQTYVPNSASQLSLAIGNEVVIQSMKNVPRNGLCLVEFQDLEGYCPFDHLSVVIEDDDIDDDVENKSYSQTISINTVEERQIIEEVTNDDLRMMTNDENDQSVINVMSGLQEELNRMELKPAKVNYEFERAPANNETNVKNSLLGELETKLTNLVINPIHSIEDRMKANKQQNKNNESDSLFAFQLKKVKRDEPGLKKGVPQEPENPLKYLKTRKRNLLQPTSSTVGMDENELQRKLSRRKSLNGELNPGAKTRIESIDTSIFERPEKTQNNLNRKIQMLAFKEEDELPPPPDEFLNINNNMGEENCSPLLPPPPLDEFNSGIEDHNHLNTFVSKPATKPKTHNIHNPGHIENKIKINEAPMRCPVIAPPPPPQMPQTQNVPTETIQQTTSDEINNAQNRSNFLNSIKGFSRQNLRRIPNTEKIDHSQSKTTKGTINSLEETLKKGFENVITSRRFQLAGDSDDEDENDDEMDGWDGEE